MNTTDTSDVSLLALDQYLREVRWIQPLTHEDEVHLLGHLVQGNRERQATFVSPSTRRLATQARDRLAERYQPLVIHIAKRYRRYVQSMQLLDVVQEGNLGLLKALDTYDASEASPQRFVSFAGKCIGYAIVDALFYRDGMIRFTSHATKLLRRLAQAEQHLKEVLHREPTLKEVSEQLHISEEEIREMRVWRQGRTVKSVQELLIEDEHEDRYAFTSLYEEHTSVEHERGERLQTVVHETLASAVTHKQRKALAARYGLDEYEGMEASYKEAARRLGVTDGSIIDAEQRAFRRLREAESFVDALVEQGFVA